MKFARAFYFITVCVLHSAVKVSSDSDAEFKFVPNKSFMSQEERRFLKEEAKEMFYHAYNSYMDNAYPADELMPLSCCGRWRDTEPSRGDIDETLGNFSLTLVDALDTLVILGDLEEFERALKLIIKDVSFDHDIVVSVFETNIRMVGGLLSGHILAEHLNQLYGVLGWYRGELLTMAQDLATRLLPAFNTTTGVPYPKVNLRYGMKSPKLQNSRDTCTSCAGTIILEFASLSRLTGESIFEEKARQAMDYLWGQRHRGSDLVGTVLNIHSGDWVRRDSGVGAGIDSYYEYLLKAYVLLGDEGYLDRFNRHYTAVMKYVSQGPMLLDVHMHRPHTTSRNYMDALLAFWPGLQVLKGDIKPAIETHEMLYQVIQRHNFLPEAFTTDFQVHWAQSPLRPEFVESTYLLYQATGDHYYLRAGEYLLKSLQKKAWVPCGYAAVKDVRTGAHEDRMDSFVLAETFKYLYLLFADPADSLINLDEFIFSTEAHLLPLSLARLSNLTALPLRGNVDMREESPDDDVEYARSCPNAYFLFPGYNQFAETIRRPLKNMVSSVCPTRKQLKRKLRASEFQSENGEHQTLLKNMGITMTFLPDGRVQLLHTVSSAKTPDDAEEGMLFLQEMIEISKMQQAQPENPPKSVTFSYDVESNEMQDAESGVSGNGSSKHAIRVVSLVAGPAQFGKELVRDVQVAGKVVRAVPFKACVDLENSEQIAGQIVLVERGECMFIEKARRIQQLGAVGGIVIDNIPESSAATSPMFAMSGDGTDDVTIPLVFLFRKDADSLLQVAENNPELEIYLADFRDRDVGRGDVEEVILDEKSVLRPELSDEAAGPTVRSALKKHLLKKGEEACSEDVASAERAIEEADLLVIDEENLDSFVTAIENANTAEEVLSLSLEFIEDHQDFGDDDNNQETFEERKNLPILANKLQHILMKKFGRNPNLLTDFVQLDTKNLLSVLRKATPPLFAKSVELNSNLLAVLKSSLSSFQSVHTDMLEKEAEIRSDAQNAVAYQVHKFVSTFSISGKETESQNDDSLTPETKEDAINKDKRL